MLFWLIPSRYWVLFPSMNQRLTLVVSIELAAESENLHMPKAKTGVPCPRPSVTLHRSKCHSLDLLNLGLFKFPQNVFVFTTFRKKHGYAPGISPPFLLYRIGFWHSAALLHWVKEKKKTHFNVKRNNIYFWPSHRHISDDSDASTHDQISIKMSRVRTYNTMVIKFKWKH